MAEWGGGRDDGETDRVRRRDRCKSKSPFWGFLGGEGQGGLTSVLLEGVILVRSYQFFFVWMTFRGLPRRRA